MNSSGLTFLKGAAVAATATTTPATHGKSCNTAPAQGASATSNGASATSNGANADDFVVDGSLPNGYVVDRPGTLSSSDSASNHDAGIGSRSLGVELADGGEGLLRENESGVGSNDQLLSSNVQPVSPATEADQMMRVHAESDQHVGIGAAPVHCSTATEDPSKLEKGRNNSSSDAVDDGAERKSATSLSNAYELRSVKDPSPAAMEDNDSGRDEGIRLDNEQDTAALVISTNSEKQTRTIEHSVPAQDNFEAPDNWEDLDDDTSAPLDALSVTRTDDTASALPNAALTPKHAAGDMEIPPVEAFSPSPAVESREDPGSGRGSQGGNSGRNKQQDGEERFVDVGELEGGQAGRRHFEGREAAAERPIVAVRELVM